MSQSPLISIAIPTKNRPGTLLRNVQACLKQSYTNFEIVIAENSDDDTASRNILALINDARVRYVRTGKLSMPDNWEKVLECCQGDLLFPIGDKCILASFALENILLGYSLGRVDVVCFNRHYNKNIYSSSFVEPSEWKVVESKSLHQDAFWGDIQKYNEYGGVGYGLVFTRRIYDELKKKFGRVVIPVAPDYTLAYILTLYSQNFSYCSKCFLSYDEKSTSNGINSQFDSEAEKLFFAEMNMQPEDFYSFVPLKVRSLKNGTLNDFIRVCHHVGIEYDVSKIDCVRYWKMVYGEIVDKIAYFHISRDEDLLACFRYLNENNIVMNHDVQNFLEQHRFVPATQVCSGAISPSLGERILRKMYSLVKRGISYLRRGKC